MKKNLFKHLSSQRGVTLIELLAVIVILGIIAAIAVPAVLTQINEAETGAQDATDKVIVDAADRYFVMNSNEADVTLDELVSGGYLKSLPDGYAGTTTVEPDGTITTP